MHGIQPADPLPEEACFADFAQIAIASTNAKQIADEHKVLCVIMAAAARERAAERTALDDALAFARIRAPAAVDVTDISKVVGPRLVKRATVKRQHTLRLPWAAVYDERHYPHPDRSFLLSLVIVVFYVVFFSFFSHRSA
jgi:hypothetical protein